MLKNIPYVSRRKKLFFTLLLIPISFKVFSQTTVFTDDFTTNTSTTYTTTGIIGTSAWNVARSGNDWGGRINSSPQQLELTNDLGATGNANGWVFIGTNTSSFSSPYNATLSLNTGLVTWTFNMRQIRTDPGGFVSGNYGVAFILAGTSSTNNNTGSGYAVVLGQGGATDPVRLVKYSNGIQGTLINLITSNTTGLTDFGAEYLSIQVTYDPATNTWELFLRNDGTAAFSDPSSGTLISQGTVVDNTNTSTSLGIMGAYWQGSFLATQTAFFDNVKVTITDPSINISPASPGAGYVYPNTTDNILYSIKLSVTSAGAILTGLTVNTGGTYVVSDLSTSPFKLYINSSNSLSGAIQLGSVQLAVSSGGSVSFTGVAQSISSGTTRYLLMTADISSTATMNNNINIGVIAFSDITFSGNPFKTGSDPLSAGNSQTIYYGASLSNSGSPSSGNIAQSSTDNTIFGFAITPINTYSLIDFSSITITTYGTATSSDVSNFRIVKDVDGSGDYTGGDIVVSNILSFSNSMTFTISNDTDITTTSYYILIMNVAPGATVGNTIIASINTNNDVTLNGNIISTASYSGYTQTIINPAVTSTASDFFKSIDPNGNWSTTSTWQSSLDGATSWHTATLVPTSSAKGITISNGTIVTINSNASAKALVIETLGILKHTSGIVLTIANGTGTDFIIDGTYVLNGTAPTFSVSATAQVNSGGVVRADDNTGGQSDAFASSSKVLFKTGSVFQWNTTLTFSTSGTTYFQGTGFANEKPIFRITANLGFLGGNLPLTINGKLEATTGTSNNIRFRNAGAKIFRDGLGGNGKFTHQAGSGPFQISGSSAAIDGTVQINIDDATTVSNDFEILEGAFVTVSGSPTININAGSDLVINGIIKHQGAQPIFLMDGNLTVNGYIDAASTGTFSAGAGSSTLVNLTIGSNSSNNSDNAGTLKFTIGNNFLNTFKMNRIMSHSNPSVVLGSDVITNNLILTRGIIATDNHLFTYNKTGSLTLPATYTDSYICTCNSSGNEITATGSNGFRISNVNGSVDQIFAVGTDFISPNRMALNMNGVTTNDYTVVVGKGDIVGTPLPRVNRIWYVSQANAASTTATMKLYFTKRDWSSYPFGNGQDEIEDGFIYSDPRLVQKNYIDLFVNTSTKSTADVPDYTNNSTYPYDTEIFGRYYLGISSDYQGSKNGINSFTRFSVINISDIILAAKLINFKAYQKGSGVEIDWQALNEINIDHYEVEKSTNGISFIKIASVNALNSGKNINYTNTDHSPAIGNNFYRIKATDRSGGATYTSIALVNIANSKTALSIYPNPVQNRMVNVQFTNLPKGKYELMLYNSEGQTVFRRTVEHTGGSAIENFILPFNIKPGAYILKLFNERINFTNRVVIE